MEQHRRGSPPFHALGELAFDLVNATESAALACARLLGKGEPDRVSEVAGEAMRGALQAAAATGTVVLSHRNQTYFQTGSVLGQGGQPVDLGLFPVEGASQVARGASNAVSLVVAVEPGGFAQLPPIWHVEKIVTGPAARGAVDLDDPVADNLRRIAFASNARVQDLTVAILDRPRHQDLIASVAATGARILMLEEGDCAGAVMAAMPGTGVDAAIGIADLQATLAAACCVKCLGGKLQARLLPRNDEERALVGDQGSRTFGVADLAPAADIAVAITGVTGSQLLPGVLFGSGHAESSSLLMSSRHATVRHITTRHHVVGDPS